MSKNNPGASKAPEKKKQKKANAELTEKAAKKAEKAAKKKAAKQPKSREERRAEGWQKNAARKAAELGLNKQLSVPDGLEFDSPLLATSTTAIAVQPAATEFGVSVEITGTGAFLQEVLQLLVSQGLILGPAHLPEHDNTDVGHTAIILNESSVSSATRQVVVEEIRLTLQKTAQLFEAVHFGSALATQAAAEGLFEAEADSQLGNEAAEILVAEDIAVAEDFLDSLLGEIIALQEVAAAEDAATELENTITFGLISEATAMRLKQAAVEQATRQEIATALTIRSTTVATGEFVDSGLAGIIDIADAQAREFRAKRDIAFKRVREAQTRGRRDGDREGRFLSSYDRRELAELALSGASDAELTEAAERLQVGDSRVLEAIAGLDRLWSAIRKVLVSGVATPEMAVVMNAPAMRILQTGFASLRELRMKIEKLPAAFTPPVANAQEVDHHPEHSLFQLRF